MKIILHGSIASPYGEREYEINGSKLYVLLNGLPIGLRNEIMKKECAYICHKSDTDDFYNIDDKMIGIELSNYDELHIFEKIGGNEPVSLTLIAGFMAMGASAATAGILANIVIFMVVAIALGGIATLIMGSPSMGPDGSAKAADAAKRKSFLFNGGINTVEQGGAVPLVYGFTRVGSTVISAGISTKNNSTGLWEWSI
jgi:predicted phage tail protein